MKTRLPSLAILLAILALSITRDSHATSSLATKQPPLETPASTGYLANLEGRAVDRHTGQPLPEVLVRVPDFDLTTRTDPHGRFAWRDVPLPTPVIPTTVIITAQGYGDWQIQGVRLIAGDTLILTAELGDEPTEIVVPPPETLRLYPPLDGPGGTLKGLSGDLTGMSIPKTIRVRVAGPPYHCNPLRNYTVETVDFHEYVRHVLPNEWYVIGGGDEAYWESMRAGAMAVKMYAWYWIAQGGKWPDADVWDSTCDQVYNPAVEYASSNAVVDYTWNWRLTRQGELVETNYRAYHTQCPIPESCMGQVDADQMAANRATWDEILYYFYQNTLLSPVQPPPPAAFNLRFFGNGHGLYDRVQVAVDLPGAPVDVGAQDFTIEWWLKARGDENIAPPITCGANQDWLLGNVLLDRERRGQDRFYGVSLAGGHVVFGVTGEDPGSGAESRTLCSTSTVTDGFWHHIAVQRRRADGFLWLFVDGVLEASADGPDGDISFPDGAPPLHPSDPFLVIGAGKRDDQPETHPPFSGWIDELHFSGVLRYAADFTPSQEPLTPDGDTLALYPFDDGFGNVLSDVSAAPGGPSHGDRRYGGVVNGPDWVISDLFLLPRIHLPTLGR